MTISKTKNQSLPNQELLYRSTGTRDGKSFYQSGKQSVADIKVALETSNKNLSDFKKVLDFGCGCGRILQELQRHISPDFLYATDIDEEAINWDKEHFQKIHFSVNQPTPPTEFQDNFFDLVFSHSTFTHMDETYQDKWLRELQRITHSGSYLVLSIHGEYAFKYLELDWYKHNQNPSLMRNQLEEKGILFVTDDEWQNSSFPDFYHTTFHAPWYIEEHWSNFFNIKAHLPRAALNYQDLLVLEGK